MNTKQSPTSCTHPGSTTQAGQSTVMVQGICPSCGKHIGKKKSELEPMSNTEELVKEITEKFKYDYTHRGMGYKFVCSPQQVEMFLRRELTTVIETTRKETIDKAKDTLKGYMIFRMPNNDYKKGELEGVDAFISQLQDKYLTEGEGKHR